MNNLPVENKKSYTPVFIAILSIIILGVLGYLIYFYYPSIKAGKVGGTIYLSLIPNNESKPLGIYTLDIKNRKLKEFLVDESANLSPTFTADGTKMAFARKEAGQDYFQILVATPNSKEMKKVTDDLNWRVKREPVWSPSGEKIAYIVQDFRRPSAVPDAWEVFLADLSGKSEFIARGVNPIFSPDGTKLLILGDKGLYVYDLFKNASDNPVNGKMGEVVVPLSNNGGSQTMKLSVSPDKSKLAWSSPLNGVVRVYDITSWNPFAIKLIKEMSIHAYWSLFSPDDKYLALQEVDWGLIPKNPRVAIYDLVNYERYEVINLENYIQPYLWMSAWQ
jgi:Tol biopolymer transport system component